MHAVLLFRLVPGEGASGRGRAAQRDATGNFSPKAKVHTRQQKPGAHAQGHWRLQPFSSIRTITVGFGFTPNLLTPTWALAGCRRP